jgi:hypothetical protein
MPAPTIVPKPLAINFGRGRSSQYPTDLIVIHVTEGDASSVVEWFSSPTANKGKPSNVSSHYMVRTDGLIVQFVDESDTAWHAGRVNNPTARLVLDRLPVNPNAYSIGIEHEGTGTEPLAAAQRAASVGLIRDIAKRHGIPVNRLHIVGHHEIFAPKTCPGAIDVDGLVTEAASGVAAAEASARVDYPRIVYSSHLGDYLVVTKYVSDDEWYFVPLKTFARFADVTRAGTRLSRMPHTEAAA